MKIKLTEREKDVIRLLIKGLKNHEIGKELSISTHTVKANFENIYEKFGIHNRVVIAVKATLEGLV